MGIAIPRSSTYSSRPFIDYLAIPGNHCLSSPHIHTRYAPHPLPAIHHRRIIRHSLPIHPTIIRPKSPIHHRAIASSSNPALPPIMPSLRPEDAPPRHPNIGSTPCRYYHRRLRYRVGVYPYSQHYGKSILGVGGALLSVTAPYHQNLSTLPMALVLLRIPTNQNLSTPTIPNPDNVYPLK